MSILALDLGTHTGFALYEPASGISSGTQSFQPKRFEGGGMRFLKFKRWLSELKGEGVFETVYFEEVRRHMGVDAAHVYGGLLGILTSWCEARQIPYEGVPVGTIKKSFTGKGNADKIAMVIEAKRRGYDVGDDNEADAIALLLWAREQITEGETVSSAPQVALPEKAF